MWIFIVLGILGFLLLVLVISAIIVASGTFYYHHKEVSNVPSDIEQRKDMEPILEKLFALEKEPYQDIYISSFDKTKLRGRFYRYNGSNKYAILFHGYHGTAIRDFSGGFWILKDEGFNILLVDERAHGLSKSKVITMGVKEKRDVKAWSEYITNTYQNSEIVLVGISMGAASILMASDLDLPSNVKCMIADCPYNSVKDICLKTCTQDLHVPAFIGWPVLILGAFFSGFNIYQGNAMKSVEKTNIPCLIIHGESDTLVPPEMSKMIYDANQGVVERHTFPHATHGLSYLVDEHRYIEITSQFINKYFK